jgi:glycosyltransferase involved in cell wall biosynthesis
MFLGKRIAVTMPAYYAAKTVEKTWRDIPRDVVDTIIMVDDASKDDGAAIAEGLGITVFRNEKNLNYGGNVKRCLQAALDAGADVIVLLHPDAQYSPKMIPALAASLIDTPFDVCLASRMGGTARLTDGMPIWKYIPNRALTHFMGWCWGCRHTEFHTGYRAYSRKALETIPFHELSNNFIFDNEALVAALQRDLKSAEISCPIIYEEDSSSISFSKSVRYGLECLRLAFGHLAWRLGFAKKIGEK